MQQRFRRIFPILSWAGAYSRRTFSADITAAVIVTVMLIPQSLAYAMLAGLPPEVGLYASILPLIAYSIFGTSSTLAVGPVAVASLMTAAAIGTIAERGTIGYLEAAILLAFLSGIFLTLMGIFRLGFLANFLSHPVISGFISASGILIAVSQFKHILGVDAASGNLFAQLNSLITHYQNINLPTLLIGVGSIMFLYFVRLYLKQILLKIRFSRARAEFLTKAGPVLAVITTTTIAAYWSLQEFGVQIVGAIPQGLPTLSVPAMNLQLAGELAVAAFLISVIGFVESISVAQTLAAKRRQQINPNQELIALGAANLASGFSGGYPVTGGFARSVVNFDAGAATPGAGAFTAIGIAVATMFLTPFLYFLPKATLAATIIVAVLSLVDFGALKRTWRYSKSDFTAMALTILLTLTVSVEVGVMTGVLVSLLLHLYRTSHPHCAVVGQVPGTEHFRNILRHKVLTHDEIISLRVDASLYFANARFLEDKILQLITDNKKLKHLILMCTAVNEIDASALESLEAINYRLRDAGVIFHLSEVKGPVMDRLTCSTFLEELTGKVFLSQFQAIKELMPDTNGSFKAV